MNLHDLLRHASRRTNLSYIITIWVLNGLALPFMVLLYGFQQMATFILMQVIVTGTMTAMHLLRKGEDWIKWFSAISLPLMMAVQLAMEWNPTLPIPWMNWYIALIPALFFSESKVVLLNSGSTLLMIGAHHFLYPRDGSSDALMDSYWGRPGRRW